MKTPKYFYYRVRSINKGTGVEIEDASDVDVVEVVRCKDCKWFERKYSIWADRAYTECSYLEAPMGDDDYCSWGERREDETD